MQDFVFDDDVNLTPRHFFSLDLEGGVPVEVYEALRVSTEKLQMRFTSLMQEKADLKDRMEELEHRCIQLSGETDTIGEKPLGLGDIHKKKMISQMGVRWLSG